MPVFDRSLAILCLYFQEIIVVDTASCEVSRVNNGEKGSNYLHLYIICIFFAAELFILIFHSFVDGIANTISSFKW